MTSDTEMTELAYMVCVPTLEGTTYRFDCRVLGFDHLKDLMQTDGWDKLAYQHVLHHLDHAERCSNCRLLFEPYDHGAEGKDAQRCSRCRIEALLGPKER